MSAAQPVRRDSLPDALTQFRDAIEAAGLTPPEEIESDGVLHRFSSNGKSRDTAGWYILFDDGIPAGAFGDWRTGTSETWRADIGRRLSAQEEAQHRARLAAMRRERDAEDAERHAKARKVAARVCKAAHEVGDAHPYLIRKGVAPTATLREINADELQKIIGYAPKSDGVPLSGRVLVVPVYVGGELSTIEFIDEAGRKSALAGGRKSGGSWPTQPLPEGDGAGMILLVGEGVATVISAAAATGHIGVAALSCGNLLAATSAIRERYPTARVIVLADIGNGQRHAEDAARKTGALLALPRLANGQGSDFNDMQAAQGIEAVRAQIEAAAPVQREPDREPDDDTRPEPQPLPDKMPSVPAFDPQLLPATLRAWIQDIAERMQCPIEFPAIGALVCLASLIGRRVAIRPKQKDDWTIIPNLWGAIVGRPGLLKTPALEESKKPLHRLIADAQKEHAGALAEFAALKEERDARENVLRADLRNALKGKGDRSKDTILADLKQLREQGEPQELRFLTNDSTVEKLGELLAANPNGILIFRDELTGWLRTLDREGHEGDRSFYLEAWAGTGSFTYDRIGRGTIHIEAACVSLLGSIQPGPLADYVRGAAGNGSGADGLLQRFQMLVYPDDPKEWRNVDRWPNTEAKNIAFQTFERLANLDPDTVGARRDAPEELPYLRFGPEAQVIFNEWLTELESKLRGNEPEYLEAHLSKYRKLVPALALLLHLADKPEGGQVSDDAMLKAAAWAEFLEAHAKRVYAEALNPGISAAHELARRIKSGDLPETFSPRDVYRNCWHSLDRDGALDAIDRLEALGWLTVVEHETGGRPTKLCTVNARILV